MYEPMVTAVTCVKVIIKPSVNGDSIWLYVVTMHTASDVFTILSLRHRSQIYYYEISEHFGLPVSLL